MDIFIEIIPELLALGEERQALAEIEIVINQYPYRLEPILHLYGALLFLKLSSPSVELEHDQVRYTLQGVSDVDQAIAIVPHQLLMLRDRGDQGARSILKEAERKFETVLNVGRFQRKRGRTEISRSRSRAGSCSRSRSKSRTGNANRSRSRGSYRVKQEEWKDGVDSDEEEDAEEEDEIHLTAEDEAEEPRIEVGNDEWARNMARAYLEVVSTCQKEDVRGDFRQKTDPLLQLRAPSAAAAGTQDSDNDMLEEDNS